MSPSYAAASPGLLSPGGWARRLRPWCAALRLTAAGASGALLALTPTTAVAEDVSPEDEEKGRELAVEAYKHYQAGEYQEALEKFEEARAIYPTGQVLRMTGYTLVALEQWVRAADMLEEALRATYKPLTADDQQAVKTFMKEPLQHIAAVSVSSKVVGAVLKIDNGVGRELPTKVFVEPGKRVFEVSADGHESVTRTRELKAGQDVVLIVDPPAIEGDTRPPPVPAPVTPPPADTGEHFPFERAVGGGLAGVGLAMIGVGIGLGVYGASTESDVQSNIDAHNAAFGPDCSANPGGGSFDACYYNTHIINSDGERAQAAQNAALGVGIAGGVLAVGGTLLLLAPEIFGGAGSSAADEPSRSGRVSCTAGGSPLQGAMFGCAGQF